MKLVVKKEGETSVGVEFTVVRLQAMKDGFRLHYKSQDYKLSLSVSQFIDLTWAEVEWMMQEFKAAMP